MNGKMIEYYKGYRIPIYPTTEQIIFIEKCFVATRFIYNWTIDIQKEHYQLYKQGLKQYAILSEYDVGKMFTELRNNNEWLKEIPHNTLKNTIIHCINGYKKFFDPVYKNNRYPRYKTEKSKQSFETRENRFYFEDNMLRIEGLPKFEKIYTEFHTGFKKSDNIKFTNTVISKDIFGQYWVSFNIKHYKLADDYSDYDFRTKAIGIDLNVKNRFVLSTGEIFKAPDTSRLDKRIDRERSQVSKDKERHREKVKQLKKEGRLPIYFMDDNGNNSLDLDLRIVPMSKRAQERELKLRKDIRKRSNINRTFHHTVTKQIVEKYPDTECIVMEDLQVIDNMDSKHYMAKNTHNVGFRDIRNMMEYKCKRNNIQFMVADKEYPSSQLCSNCGYRQKIGSRKIYKCPNCGLEINRDINAAINLSNYYYENNK